MCAIETMTALPFVKFSIDQECQKNPCDPNQFISKPPTLSTCARCVPTMIDRISMTSPPASSSACEGECPCPSRKAYLQPTNQHHNAYISSSQTTTKSLKTKSPIKPNPHHHFKPTNTHIMSSDQQQQQQQPSLIGGHAQYVKGAAEVRPVPLSSLSSIHNLLTY